METKNRNRYVHRIHFSGRAECALRHWPHCMRFCLFKHIAFAFVHRKNRQWKSGKPYISASRTLKIAERKKKYRTLCTGWLQCIRMNCVKPVLQFECVVCTLLCCFFFHFIFRLSTTLCDVFLFDSTHTAASRLPCTSTQADFEYIFF